MKTEQKTEKKTATTIMEKERLSGCLICLFKA